MEPLENSQIYTETLRPIMLRRGPQTSERVKQNPVPNISSCLLARSSKIDLRISLNARKSLAQPSRKRNNSVLSVTFHRNTTAFPIRRNKLLLKCFCVALLQICRVPFSKNPSIASVLRCLGLNLVMASYKQASKNSR